MRQAFRHWVIADKDESIFISDKYTVLNNRAKEVIDLFEPVIKVANNNEVSFWYAQNILLFVKKDYLKKNKILQKEYKQMDKSFLSIVHPKLYLRKAKRYDLIVRFLPYPIKWLIIKFKPKILKI